MTNYGSRVWVSVYALASRCGTCLFLLLLTATALAQGPDPRVALTPEQVERARTGYADLSTVPDEAFDALRDAMDGWGTLVPELASAPEDAPDALTPAEVRALAGATDDATFAGGFGVVYGQFVEREPLAERPGMERWLLTAADPKTGTLTGQTVVLYVDRHASASLKPPQKGWYVWAAAYFYKPVELPSRSTGEERAYPAFVGAAFHTSQHAQGRPSDAIVWFALALAVVFGVAIVLLVVVARLRTKERSRPLAAAAARADEEPQRKDADA